MDSNTHIWRIWAAALNRWGLQDLAVTLLEVAGPMATVGAQAVYIGQPLLAGLLPGDHLQALAELLEDNSQTQAFAAFLREEQRL